MSPFISYIVSLRPCNVGHWSNVVELFPLAKATSSSIDRLDDMLPKVHGSIELCSMTAGVDC